MQQIAIINVVIIVCMPCLLERVWSGENYTFFVLDGPGFKFLSYYLFIVRFLIHLAA